MGATPDEIVTQGRGLGVELARLQQRVADVSEERSQLLRELSETHGWSHQKIADELGLSKPRIQQILSVEHGSTLAAAGGEQP